MCWQKTYGSKQISNKEAAAKIKSGDRIFVCSSACTPLAFLDELAARADTLEHVQLLGAMIMDPIKLFESTEYRGHIDYTTYFYTGFDKAGYKNGLTHINSINLSKVSQYWRDQFKPEIMVVEVSEPDKDGYMSWGCVGGAWSGDVAEIVKEIIVVVNRNQPHYKNGIRHRIHVDEVDWICRDDHTLLQFPQPEVSDADRQIAALLLPEIQDGATIQIGLGGLANAVGYGLKEKKNLSIHSEMLTDSMVALIRDGVVTGEVRFSFGLGGQVVYDYMNTGDVFVAPCSYINDPYEIGKNDRFVSINSCLMADLTGQVCSETLGMKQYSCTGGQLDFVKGAALSKGGKSFLCMKSTIQKDGKKISTVNFSLPEGAVVTVPRSEVMNIVTEYGIADIYLKPLEERINAMISIAHPDFREELRAKAIESGMIPV